MSNSNKNREILARIALLIEQNKLRIGMLRDDIVKILGEPDDVGMTSRKYKVPSIWLYGDIEFHFIPVTSHHHIDESYLFMIYREECGNPQILLLNQRA